MWTPSLHLGFQMGLNPIDSTMDLNNNKRRYYPDFYLPQYDLYLDPKNKYKQRLDKEKLDYISKSYNIVYGDVNKCKQKILELI